eukprot:Gb_09650 [translate_table: standard]
MESMVPSTPSISPHSKSKPQNHQSRDLGLGCDSPFSSRKCKEEMTADDVRVKDTVILGTSMAEAPVTPFSDRENARSLVCNVTPLTCISPVTVNSCTGSGSECDYCREGEMGTEIVEKSCSTGTPEQSTFDPFASGPENLIFAPKKAGRTVKTSADDHAPCDKLINPLKTCEIQGSRPRTARALSFEECVDTNEENHSDLKTPTSANTGQYVSEVSSKSPGVPSGARSHLVRVLDLHYDKHFSLDGHCTNGFVDTDGCMTPLADDVSLEETFIEAMSGSFVEAIVSKQYDDANLNSFISKVEDISSCGQEQNVAIIPTSPAKVFTNVADVCPGAPMKSSSKLRFQGKGISLACRKLEF